MDHVISASLKLQAALQLRPTVKVDQRQTMATFTNSVSRHWALSGSQPAWCERVLIYPRKDVHPFFERQLAEFELVEPT